MIDSPKSLSAKAEELAGWFDDNGINPAEAVAPCGYFVSGIFATTPRGDEALEQFKRTLDAAHRLINRNPGRPSIQA